MVSHIPRSGGSLLDPSRSQPGAACRVVRRQQPFHTQAGVHRHSQLGACEVFECRSVCQPPPQREPITSPPARLAGDATERRMPLPVAAADIVCCFIDSAGSHAGAANAKVDAVVSAVRVVLSALSAIHHATATPPWFTTATATAARHLTATATTTEARPERVVALSLARCKLGRRMVSPAHPDQV